MYVDIGTSARAYIGCMELWFLRETPAPKSYSIISRTFCCLLARKWLTTTTAAASTSMTGLSLYISISVCLWMSMRFIFKLYSSTIMTLPVFFVSLRLWLDLSYMCKKLHTLTKRLSTSNDKCKFIQIRKR